MNGKCAHILLRILGYVHDPFFRRTGYKGIVGPSDSHLHSNMPFAWYGDATYEFATSPIWLNTMPAIIIDGELGDPDIGVI